MNPCSKSECDILSSLCKVVCVIVCTVCMSECVIMCVRQCWVLPVAAATQEPHDLPGSLILPLCEQATSVKHHKENSVILFVEQQLKLAYMSTVLC